MPENTIIILAGIGMIAIFCQWLGWVVKLPAILFLLVAGIIAGPVTGWLNPELLFGELLFPLVSMAVAVILFEGGLTLKTDEIRGLARVVQNLVTIGLAATWAITSYATYKILGFSLELSLLFGAVTVVTGPTVIVPMLRTVRPNAQIANILRWEGIVIDPIGAVLSVLVFDYIISGHGNYSIAHTLIPFGEMIAVGLALGALAGLATGFALKKHLLPEYLHNVAILTLVVGLFALSNTIQEESGLLAVTMMGFWLANMKGVPIEDILDFKESLSILLISVLFIVLAARIEFSQFIELGIPAITVVLIMQFVARPIKVFVSTLGSELSWKERALLGWIAPRGIVAAAIASLFALKMEKVGFENADLLVPLTFMVIIGTVVFQSLTSGIIARILGVAEPEPKGFLIIGANRVARETAQALVKNGFSVLLASTNWINIGKARMEGLPTFYGNPISEHADRHLDLVGIGRMLSLSPLKELNSLAYLKYKGEFGADKVYSIQTSDEKNSPEKHKTLPTDTGFILF